MSNTISKETAPHYFWGENCDSWVLTDSKNLSVKLEQMPAGTKEQLHYHTHTQQFFFILKGTATFLFDEELIILTEQKGLLVKPGVCHFIANETDKPVDFLVISQPSANNDRVDV